VVKQLLTVDGVDVNSKNNNRYGQTALSWVAGNGNRAVVKQLPAVDGVDINSKSKHSGQMALWWVVENIVGSRERARGSG
jgi:ankyrin repeat protein